MGGVSTKIEVADGDLANTKADVLVNSIGTEAKLNKGCVSYALLGCGGQRLQAQLTEEHPIGLRVGEVAQTTGGDLQCKKVFHVVLQRWINENDEAEQVLYKVMTKCLNWAYSQNFNSIAFPALGAGFHRFPGNRAADIMFRAVEDFNRKVWFKSLATVKIILHKRDIITCEDFKAKMRGVNVTHDNYLTKEIVLLKANNGHGVCLRVETGCLSQHKADVLVNTTQSDLNLYVGGVSKSLAVTGGAQIQRECFEKHPTGLEMGQMVVTEGGDLNCEKIIHTVLSHWSNGDEGAVKIFKEVISECLKETANGKFSSVGFPVLGTGYLGFPVKNSIALMVETFVTYFEQHPNSSIRRVSIVIAHKDILMRKMAVSVVEGKEGVTEMPKDPVDVSMMISGERKALAQGRFEMRPLHYGTHPKTSPEDRHLQFVTSHFIRQLEKHIINRHVYKITHIEYVINPKLQRAFRGAQDTMEDEPIFAYHGTPEKNVDSICKNGFRMPGHEDFEEENDTGWYGNGIYLTEYPRYAMNYMQMSKRLLMCKVLRGKVCRLEKRALGERLMYGYDSHADPYAKEIVIFHRERILPCYIIHFEIIKRFMKSTDTSDPNEKDDTEIQFLFEMEMHKGEIMPGSE